MKQVDTPPDVAKELKAMVNRLCQKCETKEDFVREITFGKFYSLYTPDAVNHVHLRNPTSVLEAANQLQDFYKRKQQWKDKRQYRSRFYERNNSGGPRDEGERGETVQTSGDGRGELHGSGHGQRYGNKWVKQNSSARQEFIRERDEKGT